MVAFPEKNENEAASSPWWERIQSVVVDIYLKGLLLTESSAMLLYSLFGYTFKPKMELIKMLAREGSFADSFKRSGGYFWSALILVGIIAFPPGKGFPKSQRRERAMFASLLLLFLYRSHHRIASLDAEALEAIDARIEENEITAFRPPKIALLRLVTATWSSFFDPMFLGTGNLVNDDKPRMYVSNHTLLGMDFPILLPWLYEHHGIYLRALADHAHFQIPINGLIMKNIVGAVDGNHRNVDILLESGSSILVYPGGERETFKRREDKNYALFWENKEGEKKLGFCRAAIKHGVDIVPVINYGSEDMFEVHYDMPIGWLPIPFLWGSERQVPIMTPTSFERMYFYFGKPISTSEYCNMYDSREACLDLHEKVKQSILEGIKTLKTVQQEDKERFRFGSVRREISKLVDAAGSLMMRPRRSSAM